MTTFVHISDINILFARNRIRQYLAFVNCTTIDLFTEWPHDALLEVAERYLESMGLGDKEDVRDSVPSVKGVLRTSWKTSMISF